MITQQNTRTIHSWILQQHRNPTRVDGTVYASTKWSRGERTLDSLQSGTRGTSGSLEHLPGHPLGRGHGLYGRGSNEFVDGGTTLGFRVLQSVGYRGKQRMALPP